MRHVGENKSCKLSFLKTLAQELEIRKSGWRKQGSSAADKKQKQSDFKWYRRASMRTGAATKAQKQ